MSFKAYITNKNRNSRTVHRKDREVKRYQHWLDWRGIDIKESRYDDVMSFIGWMQAQEMTIHQINRMMQAISDYYDYLELDNPAYKVRVRGFIQTTPGPQFSAEQLDEIYDCYEIDLGSWGYQFHSNKVILGLMIYQGLELSSLLHLRLQDVDLVKGRIFMRAHNTRQERFIPLKAHQILQLSEYIEKRPEIIAEWLRIRKYLTAEEKIITDRLFSPQCERYGRIHGQYKQLSKDVKTQALEKLGYTIRKLTHLRQSRYGVWIEEVGIRKAQYYAGLRSATSIERYKKKDLKGLKRAVKKYHPR